MGVSKPLVAVLALGAALVVAGASAGRAADLTVRDITQQLFRATAAAPVDLAGKDLAELDLSGLDFKHAVLAGANLFGANLSGADLSGADLRKARLDRTIILATRFDGADLSGAMFLRPSAFSTLASPASEAPSFARAKLSGVTLFGRFNRANFRGADVSKANLAPFNNSGFIEHIWRTELLGADLSESNLDSADLRYVLFAFANFRGASLRGADLRRADLSGADLTGADLSGADLTGADLDGAVLVRARGLDTVVGLREARNGDKAVR